MRQVRGEEVEGLGGERPRQHLMNILITDFLIMVLAAGWLGVRLILVFGSYIAGGVWRFDCLA